MTNLTPSEPSPGFEPSPITPAPTTPGASTPAPTTPAPTTPASRTAPASVPLDEPNAIDEAVADDAAAAKKGKVGPLGVAAAIIFGLFYAYVLWAALGRLIDLPDTFRVNGVADVPWGLAVAALLVPIVAFVLAFVIGIRRTIGDKVLIYVAGLAAVAALTLTLIGLQNFVLAAAIAAK